MRTLRLLIASFFLLVVGSAYATDFRLVINAKPGSLDKANTLRLHGLNFKEGDKVVEVTYGKGPEMFRVTAGNYEGGTILTKPGSAKGFGGRVASMTGEAPNGSVFASLVNVAAPTQPVKRAATTASGIAGFLFSQSGLMLLGGLAVLITLGIVFRPKPKDAIYVPISKRRNVDEAIKEIIDRLEQIDAKQTDLVKKPPVLRSFGKQIAGFDSRLEEIEGQIKGMTSAQGKQTESTTALERTLGDLNARLDGAERALSNLNNSTDAGRQQVKDLANKLEVVEGHVRENGARAADTIITLQKQDEEIQNMLFVVQEGQQQTSQVIKKIEHDVSEIKGKADAVEVVTEALDNHVADLEKQIAAVDAKVVEHAARKIEVPDVRPDLQKLQDAFQTAANDRKKVEAQLADLAKQVAALPGNDYDQAFAEINQKIEAIQVPDHKADLQTLSNAVQAVEAKAGELQAAVGQPDAKLHAEVAALREAQGATAASLEEKISDLSKRIDQREAILASLQSQVSEQGQSSQGGAEMLPVIAELKLSLESLGADQAKSAAALETVSKALGELRADAHAKTDTLVKAVEGLAASPTPATDSGLADALRELKAESDAKMAALGDAVTKIAQVSEARAAGLEQALADAKATMPAPQLQVVETQVVEEPVVELQVDAAEVIEEVEEVVAEAVPEPAAEAEVETEDGVAGWTCAGGSAGRRWSSLVAQPFAIDPAAEAPKPLTPTETATIDYPMGPIVVAAGRVVYGHGETLRGFWPGKNPVSVSLKSPIPVDAWRLACTDKFVFCASTDGVEVVNAATWSVHTRFLGNYVDQVATSAGWAGLKQTDGRYFVDFRDNDGSPVGQPVSLPKVAGDPTTVVALDDVVFVGTSDASLIRVDLAGAKPLDSGAPDGAKLLSLSLYKRSLLVVVRIADQDHAFLLDGKGNVQKGLGLGFKNALDHPVVMDDRMYLVDGDGGKIVTVNLKKLEVAESNDLEGLRVATLAGVHNGKQHALLMTLKEGESNAGKVVLFDPADGKQSLICPVSHSHVEAVCANNHVVLATGCSYQNMIRVFALPVVAAMAKAA